MTDYMEESGQDIPILQAVEPEGKAAQLEPHPEAVYFLLQTYALHYKESRINFESFIHFARKYSERYIPRYPQLKDFTQNTELLLTTYLKVLSNNNRCSLEYTGDNIHTVLFPQYFTDVIKKAYKEMETNPETPFPSEELLGLRIPFDLVSAINIKTDFVTALSTANPENPSIYRLIFPEDISSIIITSDLLSKKLLEYAVYKMRTYLSIKNNAGYIQHRLVPVFKGNDHALREIVNAIIMKPGKAIGTIFEPTDFSFRFWAHFANMVIQEYKEKKYKPVEEHGLCQAAYLLGFYNVYYKGIIQKETEKQDALRSFDVQLRKSPYAFTIKHLYSLKDSKGLPLIRKETKDIFLEFLENKTKTESYKNLPEIVRLKTADKKDYYIHKDLIIPLFIKKLYETANELKESYIEEWLNLLKQGKKTLAMSDDKEFVLDLEITVKSKDPLFYSLLNFNLLFLAKEESAISYDLSRDIDRCFDEKQNRLQLLPKVLGLSRKEILESAKLYLPIWQRFPLIRLLFEFFKRVSLRINRRMKEAKKYSSEKNKSGKLTIKSDSKKPADRTASVSFVGSGTESTALSVEKRAAYKKAIKELKLHFVGKNTSIPEKLNELIENWNPLYDPEARNNLVEDVNALIRDYLRGLKRGFRVKPPEIQRIQALAEKLSQNSSFKRITRKGYFKRYIEIYMIKLLGEK